MAKAILHIIVVGFIFVAVVGRVLVEMTKLLIAPRRRSSRRRSAAQQAAKH